MVSDACISYCDKKIHYLFLGVTKKSNNLRQKDFFIAKYYQNCWLSDELQFGYQFIYQNNNSWPGYSWNPKDIVTTLNSVILTP